METAETYDPFADVATRGAAIYNERLKDVLETPRRIANSPAW